MASTTTEEIRQIRQLTNEIRSESYRYSTTQTQTTEGRIEVEADNATVDAGDENRAVSKMPLRVKMTFGAPQFSVFSIYMLISVHATLFYEYLGAKLSYLAFFTAFARSFDVLTDPLMSWWSDSTRTKHGRRRPFIAVGCWCFAFSAFLLMSPGVIAPGLVNTNGVSYWYGFTFVLFYLSDTLCNVPYNAFGPELTEDTVERSNMYFVQNIFGMVGTLIGAAGPPGVEMSFGISKEWSFCLVGIFFGIWFVASQINLVYTLSERVESQKQKPVPLVASMNRAFRNSPFATLLFASFLDSVGWFAVAATMPFYLKYVVRPGAHSDTDDEVWLAIGLTLFFVTAIIATPFWLWCCKKFGKRNTWLGFNFMNGITNSLFVFVGEGDIYAALAVTCLNGAPLGARFLNDSTLADTIDYDEFITGERREAQFTMFISFVPKVVSIPTQALPIALIAAAGFVESEGGVAQDQPALVKTVISVIYIAFPVVMNIFSFYVKYNYSIKNEGMNRAISDGIVMHAAGLPAEDPITKKVVPPVGNLSEVERGKGDLLDHFSLNDLKQLSKSANTDFLFHALVKRRWIGCFCLVGCVTGVGSTFSLLESASLNFVPSMFQIGIGLSMMYILIITLRIFAADDLRKSGVEVEFVRKWRNAIGDLEAKNGRSKMPKAGVVVQKLRQRISRLKVRPGSRGSGGSKGGGGEERKGKDGGVDVQMV